MPISRTNSSTADVLPRHNNGRDNGSRPSYIKNKSASGTARGGARGKRSWRLLLAEGNRNHFVAMIGEYVGTCLFLFLAFGGTNVANIPAVSITGDVNTSQLLYISLAFGFSLLINAWVFFRVSGGLFNPAVSLGLALVGAITWVRAALLTVAQLLGAITAAAIIDALLPGGLYVRTTKVANMNTAQALFLEMFLTSILMLTILLLAAEKHKATFLAPVGIGLALFICEMTGVFYTGGSLNPARSFGPDVVARSFTHYHWIYWLGPILGSCLAAGFYKLLKFLQYEEVNPDQDGSDEIRQSPANVTVVANAQAEFEQHADRLEALQEKHRNNSSTGVTSSHLSPNVVQPGLVRRVSSAIEQEKVEALSHLDNRSDQRFQELDAKLDMILAALSAQAAASQTSVDQAEADHDAPFSVLSPIIS